MAATVRNGSTVAMMPSLWRKACISCTKAKRQCTKQVPACRRCENRGFECEYPPTRRVPATPISAPVTKNALPNAAAAESSNSNGSVESIVSDDVTFEYPLLTLTTSETLPRVGATHPEDQDKYTDPQDTSWFLTLQSWEVQHSIPPNADPVDESKLHVYISTVRSWLLQWVTASQNPLIHPQLYRTRMPRCVSDAYTALATYVHRTSATEETAFRIIDQRVETLVQDQALEESLGFGVVDTFDHLARVHTLLIYQCIRLFDGNIRMRAQADALTSTLFLWSEQMWQSAMMSISHNTHSSSSSSSSFSSSTTSTSNNPLNLHLSNNHNSDITANTWQTWLFIESIRRAYLTTNMIQQVYLTLKRGWSECPGGVPVTLRKGAWEAETGYAWSQAIKEHGGPLFMQSRQTQRVFVEAGPGDVDEFGHALLGISFGSERMERWFGEKGGTKSALESFLGAPVLLGENR
ncbi:hypothetical protein BJ170DRAFT_695762 [Xylariales sp. AK1849]|nr:hypothetical protein BJ170DRAFT_695762 [Xylariales sp. AK1849]